MIQKVSSKGILIIRQEQSSPSTIFRAQGLAAPFIELMKVKITIFVGMSAVFGYVLVPRQISSAMTLPVLGIFLLSCGSAALNHYQERHTDALMRRTSKRPLPSGVVTPRAALQMVVALSVAGGALVLFAGNIMALVFSLLAFVSYNFIYTPLKRLTPFAVIPGSFVGSFPVMAGWSAAGGNALDPRILSVAIFFFIWQIPHFWLLMDMYDADYERANFPTLRMYFGRKTLSALMYLWIIILFLTSALFIRTGVVENIPAQVAVAALGLWLVVGTCGIVSRSGNKIVNRSAFLKINIYVLAITLTVMVDRVLSYLWKM